MYQTLPLIAVACLVLGNASGGVQATAQSGRIRPPLDAPTTPARGPRRLATTHLPNAVQVHAKVISGGMPAQDMAFQELQALGVQTIISVDAARPDVQAAAKHGMRYIHLPHGYDGIPEPRARELAKAVRDLAGPIYIHCHHGKHRSPAAASVACVTAGLLPRTEAVKVLELAGTSSHYRGLYRAADAAQPVSRASLDQLDVEFRDTVAVPPLAEAMVNLERTHDRLRQIAKAGWQTPLGHPDLEPVHEALLLREHFTELLRAEAENPPSEEFLELLRHSESAARALEAALKPWWRAGSATAPPAALDRHREQIATNCRACHEKYRDTPLGEKE